MMILFIFSSCNLNSLTTTDLFPTEIIISLVQVPGCKSRDGRHTEWSETPLTYPDYVCETDGFFCYDCETTIICIDGVAYHEENCESEYTCQDVGSFGSFTCYDSILGTGNCTCSEDASFIADPYNDQGFSYCATADTAPIFSKCEGDMVFNLTYEACVNANGAPECTKAGKYANPLDCNEYYNCLPVAGGRYKQVFKNCQSGLMYNEKTDECSDPCSWPSPFFKCTTEGRFSDPKDCAGYYICTEYKSAPGTFYQRHANCPESYFFEQVSEGFGFCSKDAQCLEATETQCAIPDTCSGVPAAGLEEEEDPDLIVTTISPEEAVPGLGVEGTEFEGVTDSESSTLPQDFFSQGSEQRLRLGFRRRKPKPDIIASISPNLVLQSTN